MVTCVACGSASTNASRFCSSCGAPLVVPEAPAVTEAPFATRTVATGSGSAQRAAQGASAVLTSESSGAHGRFIPGTLVAGRYRVVSLLGRGGMGEVYRADDLTLGQSVALKFLPESLSLDPDAVRRFRNEIRVARQVSHPNVCRVHDVGEVDGQIFLSMEYVDGEDLASLLRRIGRLPEDKATEIARKLCAGLAAAHDKGVLHRDLKPGNVMLDARGQVLLTDFGLSGLANEIAGNDIRSGTPAYMAPEQLEGKEVTARSDIYSLGLVLYELFTGKRPFAAAQTLEELKDAQQRNSPTSISSMVRDIDPAVEGIVRRCLDPDPARRPASALTVAAALPGGDPLQAALAAGETPSPELVAAAGEDVGLRVRTAVPLLVFILGVLAVHAYVSSRESMLEKLRPAMSPDVLRYQARQIIRSTGYGSGAIDSADGFAWNHDYLRWIAQHDKERQWSAVVNGRAPVLRYWYRESREPLAGEMFHDNLLTLGVTTQTDPPSTTSGSTYLELDSRGRLVEFRYMPAQKTDAPVTPAVPNWTPLFQAAGIDPSEFRPADPLWTWLEASDTRAAWTGVWPGSNRPLRIEAAALGGKPVVFSLIGPWMKAGRIPEATPADPKLILISLMVVVVLVCSVFLARNNLQQGKGDRRGAFRIALFLFIVEMTLWAARMHYHFGLGLLGYFFVTIVTASGIAVSTWLIYLALEPFVRRYWPQTLIASTRLLSGQIRDGIVGRDILVGAVVSCCWRLITGVQHLLTPNAQPRTPSEDLFLSSVGTFREVLENVPTAVQDTLLLFGITFLLRLLLRREWAAGLVFTALWVGVAIFGRASASDVIVTAVIYGSLAYVIVRYGLLAIASLIVIDGALGDMPATFDASAWFFPNYVCMLLACAALAIWAFRQAIRRPAYAVVVR